MDNRKGLPRNVLPTDGVAALPADYLAYIATPRRRRRFPAAELLAEPIDPGMALGKQGYDNFMFSNLIGTRPDGLQIVLKYDAMTTSSPRKWQYAIVKGAEWDVAIAFDSMNELLNYLEAEEPIVRTATERRPKK